MAAIHFEVERIDLTSTRSYVDALRTFEEKVPPADMSTLGRLASSRASSREIEEAVRSMAGELEFMSFAKLEQGPLTSLLGKPKKMVVFLLGNPVLANRMYEANPAIGVYAPLRASIYEDQEGRTHFTYDRPSALLAQFDHAQVRAVARALDEKMSALADAIVR
jgi:hypothetical protein